MDKRYNKYYESYTLLLSTKFNDNFKINDLRKKFYSNIDGKFIKVIPTDIASLLTPIAFAFCSNIQTHNSTIYSFIPLIVYCT